MLQLISEKLLEEEIKRIEEDEISEKSKMEYCLCKKELALIRRIKINEIDMQGKIEEFNQRIERQALYFMEPCEFENMKEKAKRYDTIAGIVKIKAE